MNDDEWDRLTEAQKRKVMRQFRAEQRAAVRRQVEVSAPFFKMIKKGQALVVAVEGDVLRAGQTQRARLVIEVDADMLNQLKELG